MPQSRAYIWFVGPALLLLLCAWRVVVPASTEQSVALPLPVELNVEVPVPLPLSDNAGEQVRVARWPLGHGA